MFELMIATFYYTFYMGVYGIFVLMLMRLYMAIKLKTDIKTLLIIVFIPASLGLHFSKNETYPLHKIYHILQIVFFIMMVLGSIFLLYMRLELNII